MNVPPPVIFLGALACGWCLDQVLVQGRLPLPAPWRLGLGLLAAAAGAGLIVAAIGLFRRAGTRPEPWKPTSAIVSTGIYARTRNPMYLVMSLVHGGLALLLDSPVALLLLPVAIVIIDRAVIVREERYLARLFGQAYEDYRTRVRRWL